MARPVTDIGSFFRKRFMRVLIPFFSWGVIFLALRHLFFSDELSRRTLIETLLDPHHTMVTLWYIQALIAFYLVVPLLTFALHPSRPQVMNYLLIVTIVVSIIIPSLRVIYPDLYHEFNGVIASTYVVFPIVGYTLSRLKIKTSYAVIFSSIFIFSYLISILFGGWASVVSHPYAGLTNSYCCPTTLLIASSLFYLSRFFCSRWCPDKLGMLLGHLAGYTFGIYLVHLIVIEVLALYYPTISLSHQMISVALVWAVSFAITALIRPIPYLRLIIGGR